MNNNKTLKKIIRSHNDVKTVQGADFLRPAGNCMPNSNRAVLNSFPPLRFFALKF